MVIGKSLLRRKVADTSAYSRLVMNRNILVSIAVGKIQFLSSVYLYYRTFIEHLGGFLSIYVS